MSIMRDGPAAAMTERMIKGSIMLGRLINDGGVMPVSKGIWNSDEIDASSMKLTQGTFDPAFFRS